MEERIVFRRHAGLTSLFPHNCDYIRQPKNLSLCPISLSSLLAKIDFFWLTIHWTTLHPHQNARSNLIVDQRHDDRQTSPTSHRGHAQALLCNEGGFTPPLSSTCRQMYGAALDCHKPPYDQKWCNRS